jgi:hypothetical protein
VDSAVCDPACMVISRADRRTEREARATAEFGENASAVLDGLKLTDFRDVRVTADRIRQG